MAANADDDPDKTVRVVHPGPPAGNPPSPPSGRRRGLLFLVLGVLAAGIVAGGGGAWWFFVPAASVPQAGRTVTTVPGSDKAITNQPSTDLPKSPVVAVVARAPTVNIRGADEATILADDPTTLTVFQFVPNPAIIVLDFPTLAQQGHMLNRIAVLVEKAGAPHDRVLNDADLDKMIRGGGDTSATYYLGHDYRSTEILNFFALADRDHVELDNDELWLRALVRQLGWTPDGPLGALISIPRVDPDNSVDMTTRQAILHHELSHGEYFTDLLYADFVHRFWMNTMTADERAQLTSFLARDNYDPAIEDLMMNESIAYMIHTPDPRFFNAALVKMSQRHLLALRADFYRDMPAGWLRDATSAPLPPPAAAASPHRVKPRRRRRRHGFGAATVSTKKTLAVRRVPGRRSARSIAA
jgi:hypothetical protein